MTLSNKIKVIGLSICLTIGLSVSAQKNKFLEGKKYNVMFYEMKASGRGKAVSSNFLIKGGKVESDLMYEKLKMEPATYKVTLDSTYTEDETEMHLINLEAELSMDKNDFKWEATITNYDIEGTIVQLKGGVEKKKYEFNGSEKTKK
jgi:hypothetical protein